MRSLERDALYDFAASRAYYTMFYVAKALLESHGYVFSKHSQVIGAFGQRLTKPGIVPVQFHRFLIDAEDLRNTGDYGAIGRVTAEDVVRVADWAQQFLDLAEQLLGPLPPLAEEQT